MITVKTDLKQRDVRKLEMALLEVPERLIMRASSSHHEAMLKAAIAAGWITEPECKVRDVTENGERTREYWLNGSMVDDMAPRECYAAGHVIEVLYQEFTSLDPN